MRLFVATRLAPEVRGSLRPRIEALVEASAGVLRAVPAGSEHFTHVFLGQRDVDPHEILRALAPMADTPVFRVELFSPSIFPTHGRPRLVCLGVDEGEAALTAIAAAVRDHLVPLFPDLESYALKPPHVTLARFRKRSNRRAARAAEEHLEAGASTWRVTDRIARIELIRSVLSSSGASYEVVGEVAFGSARRAVQW